LGQSQMALDCLQEAVGIPTWEKAQLGVAHGNLALVLVDQRLYDRAIEEAIHAVQIGNDVSAPRVACLGNIALCLASLESADLAMARAAAEAAEQSDQPLQNHISRTLLGVVALRQGDRATAQTELAKAITDAQSMLNFNPRCFRALDTL